LSHLSDATFTLGDLEAAVESVPHPGRWLDFFDYKTGGNAVVLSRHRAVDVRPNLRAEVAVFLVRR